MKDDYDLVIVGGGAAGLSAAQYGARANLRTLLLEETAPGGQALLIDHLENYPGCVEQRSGYDFANAMREQAERFGAEMRTGQVGAVVRRGGGFEIDEEGGRLRSAAVIAATGAEHRKLGVPGEAEFSGRGVSYCATCDGPFFKGKRILVVGGGDAACDEAGFLAKLSDRVVMVHRGPAFRAQKAVAARALGNPNIQVRFNQLVRGIRGDSKVRSVELEHLADGSRYAEEFDAVFVFVGSNPRSALFAEAERDESGYLVADQRMATSVPGLFVAGDLRASPFRQVVVAAADGAIAAHSAAQYLDGLLAAG
ncbi:MAG TPA: FAD-dependent oxidoreductase [Rectinemataceae bacterium]|nr:FAD-dependent oxidoreductase [Rectinemataceae bacterium]